MTRTAAMVKAVGAVAGSNAMLIKPLDFGILLPAFCLVAASFAAAYSGAKAEFAVNLKGDGGEWVFPADVDETVHVSGPLGETVVEIRRGAARVLSSPCVNQTCVAAGVIHAPGQWAACLPNRVMLYIGGGNRGGMPRKQSPESPGRDNAENAIDAAAW